MNYYNDNEPFVCEWLTNLMADGLIPPGEVDGRSITDVRATDLKGFTQCHFFAGIAGWPLAFEIARWPDDRPVWSASCPCPPFSVAGKQTGCPECKGKNIIWDPGTTGQAICADCSCEWFADARHLWPEVWRLAAECRPRHLFGEQVASPQGLEWLAGVRGSLEILGYAVGATDLPAASVGAPQIRQRLFWVANSRYRDGTTRTEGSQPQSQEPVEPLPFSESTLGRMGNAPSDDERGTRQSGEGSGRQEPSGRSNPWDDSIFILCADGKSRPTLSGLHPLAHGVSARASKLRAYGNAIVPLLAAAFIRQCINGIRY